MIQHQLIVAYPRYKDFPHNLKENWFKQFTQDYHWEVELTPRVRKEFDKQCCTAYKNNIHEWKKFWKAGKGKVPKNCNTERFKEFIVYWEHKDIQKVAKMNTSNRNSDRGGFDIAAHNNGTQTYEQRSRVLASQLGEEPDLFVLMEDTHMNKNTKVVEDKKVLVLAKVRQKRDEILTQRSQDGASCSAQPTHDEIDLVIESTPCTKGRPFGLGNLVTSDGMPTRVTQSHLSQQEREVLVELRVKQQDMERQLQENNAKFQEFERMQKEHMVELAKFQTIFQSFLSFGSSLSDTPRGNETRRSLYKQLLLY